MVETSKQKPASAQPALSMPKADRDAVLAQSEGMGQITCSGGKYMMAATQPQ